jgi:predicted permease
MSQFLRRLRYLLNRRRFDQELAGELEFHREMAGNIRLGNPLRLREEARDAWGWTWIDRLSQDLRYAFRKLRQSPGFTITAVLMLALGVGVNVAAFGFFNLMVLRPLPVRDPGTLLHFRRASPQGMADNFPYPEAAFFSEYSKNLSAVMAANLAKLKLDRQDTLIDANFVTVNYFKELGAIAKLGRLLDPNQDHAPAVVLSYPFWRRSFASDPSIAGKTVHLNGKPVTIIGVAAADFSGLGSDPPDVWAPITQQPYFVAASSDGSWDINVQMWGRLKPGVTPAVAEAELASLAAQLRQKNPKDIWENETLPSEPGGYAMAVRPEMYPVLALASALGLLILGAACATLSSLLLARGVSREREIAIRISIGAGRARLMRQLFTESLVLALLGSIAGLALDAVTLRMLMTWTDSPAWLNAAPDWRVTVFAIGLGFAAAILFGLMPAWQIARQRYRATKVRHFLIGAQVAASCVLLIVASLFVRALNHALTNSPGYEYREVISIDPRLDGYSPEQAAAYFDTLKRRLSHVPGVESISMASNPPLGNRWTVNNTRAGGHPLNIHFNNIDPQFFHTMKIPLLLGRNLTTGDRDAIVVSDSLARIEWPSEDPIGKTFDKGTVVGVSANARLVSPEDSDAVEVYHLAQPDLLPQMVVLLRTSRPPEAMVSLVASLTKSIDSRLFPETQLLRTSFNRKMDLERYATVTFTSLGFLAMMLACLGIVGVVAYAVSQRTKEIGIRMALGARPPDVLSIVLRQFSSPVIAGLVGGTGAAAALSQLLRRQLYGISNLDLIAYLAAIAVFTVAAGLAAWLPARRALRIDPMVALRYE